MIALIAGASGLVGGAVAHELAGRLGYRATALLRRPLPVLPASIEQVICDFARLDLLAPVPEVSVVFCALGTTIGKAGSKAAFRAVDHDAILSLAAYGRRCGARRFSLVSSVGASAMSPSFYLRVKGETESALASLGYEALDLFRPSFLMGERAEPRPGEAIGISIARWLGPLLSGSLEKYRGIDASTVAKAMVEAAAAGASGTAIYHYREMIALAARARRV